MLFIIFLLLSFLEYAAKNYNTLDICENYVREVHQFPRFNSKLSYFAGCIGRRIFSGSDTSLVATFYFNDEYTLSNMMFPISIFHILQ